LQGRCLCADCAEIVELPRANMNPKYWEIKELINFRKALGHCG